MAIDKSSNMAGEIDALLRDGLFEDLLYVYSSMNTGPVVPWLSWLRHVATHVISALETYEVEALRALSCKSTADLQLQGVPNSTRTRALDLLAVVHTCDWSASLTEDPAHALEEHLALVEIAKHQGRRIWNEGRNDAGASDQLRLTALLVNEGDANPSNQGVVCELTLVRICQADIPHGPELAPLHGALVRAPYAYLLDLDDKFEQSLQHAQSLLRHAIEPVGPNQQAQVLAWSLNIAPLAKTESQLANPLLQITGPSLGAWIALASLHLLVDALKAQWKTQWGEALRNLHLPPLCATAALDDFAFAPDGSTSPFDWPLSSIGGATVKLAGLQLEHTGWRKVDCVLLHKDQKVSGNQISWEPISTIGDAINEAHRRTATPLAAELDALYQALLRAPVVTTAGHTASKTVDAELLQQAELVAMPGAAMAHTSLSEVRTAIKASLLKRYAYWAGGHYQPFGGRGGGRNMHEPVMLARHFYPVAIAPDRLSEQRQGPPDPCHRTNTEAASYDGLEEVLHQHAQTECWLLTAAPAGGKTTLLASYEMHSAHAALKCYAKLGSFGEVALWLPMRDYSTTGVRGAPAAMNALWMLACQRYPALAPWLREQVRSNEFKPIRQMGLRVRWLLDAVNEMAATNADARQKVLGWLDSGLQDLRQQAPDIWLPRIYTVRTHNRGGTLPHARHARLLPWDDQRRKAYMVQRLGRHSGLAEKLQEAIRKDPADDANKFFATPGHLAIQCSLFESGMVQEPAQHRAELFCTLLWVRLYQERALSNIREQDLSDAEAFVLDHLQRELTRPDGWRWPTKRGPLVTALTRLAVSQQHLDPGTRQRQKAVGSEERVWAMGATMVQFSKPPHMPGKALSDAKCKQLIDAAGQLNVLKRNGRDTLEWGHQLWLELFAAMGLAPEEDSVAWLDAAWPELTDLEALWQDHLRTNPPDRPGKDIAFRLPAVTETPDAQVFRYLVQLRGDVVDIVKRVMNGGSAALAARLALENLNAFGEQINRIQDAWRAECTHPLLNQLRQTLLERSTSREVDIRFRLEAAELAGTLGGDPRFELCGEALILREEYWQSIGERGMTVEFQKLDRSDPRPTKRKRSPVTLSSFAMAGLLTTNAQYLCFAQSREYSNPRWWLGLAAGWFASLRTYDAERLPWGLRPINSRHNANRPIRLNYWQALAYSRFESAQRSQCGKLHDQFEVSLPTEDQWQCAALMHSQFIHWPFDTKNLHISSPYQKVRPWDFNHASVYKSGPSPVGVFLNSSDTKLHDLAGNVCEWTISGSHDGSIHGGFYDSPYSRCSPGGSRVSVPLEHDLNVGFRLLRFG